MSDLLLLAPDAITVEEGANPRGDFNGDALAQLTASVKMHGVIQPLLVRPDGDGYVLVAGERRLRAARDAKLATVPCVVREGAGLIEAITENVHRDNLDPVEEARAFGRAVKEGKTVRGVATALALPERFVKERLALLALPDDVLGAIQRGQLTLGRAAALVKLGHPALASAIVRYAVNDPDNPYDDHSAWDPDSEQDVAYVAEHAIRSSAGDGVDTGVYVGSFDSYDKLLAWLGSDDADRVWAAVEPGLVGLPPTYGGGGFSWWSSKHGNPLQLEKDALDAATAFGCVLQLGRQAWITDKAWLVDRLVQQAEAWSKKRQPEIRAAKKAGKVNEAGEYVAPERPSHGQERGEAAAEKAAETRKQAAEDRPLAIEDNAALGKLLPKKLGQPKVTTDAVKLAVLLVFHEYGEQFASTLRYVDDRFQRRETTKRGEKLVIEGSKRECQQLLAEWLSEARTTEDWLGKLTVALAAARYADSRVVSESQRIGHPTFNPHAEAYLPHQVYGEKPRANPYAAIPQLVEKLTKATGLPERVLARDEERKREPEPEPEADLDLEEGGDDD